MPVIKIAAMIGAPDLEQETLAVYSGDLAAAFGKVARLGYDGVELMTKDPTRLDGAQILRWLETNQLELAGLCTGHVYGEDGLGLVGPDADICRQAMARLKTFVDFAAAHFGPDTLINIGRSRGPGFAGDPTTTLDRMTKAFVELADYALPHGIRLVLEPINVHQADYVHTSQDGLDMVKRVNRPNFGLMLDVYHMNIEDVDIYDSFREASTYCWFVHFADNNRKWPGSAHLDFGRIVQVLNETGYDGYVSMEILPWPDPDTAAKSSIEFLRRYIRSTISNPTCRPRTS
jgi:sugar phosphate isomerase/epimerase